MAAKNGEKKIIHCAIYTRKSTHEGLDQEFNSLDAQREAAEAYIQSQKHEGWTILSQRYDDGGYTGGNLDRPALQQLMEDVKEGLIDIIIVYKVDRLSRTLLDFAKIIELLNEHNVSFVSITQHFNTSTSLGRLTLHILLSFAQFERELISERTRDKMGATRRKGKWCGGKPPLGYDLNSVKKRLIINTTEGALVRKIFQLYVKLKSSLAVTKVLNKKGLKTKTYRTKKGVILPGREFSVSQVHRILTSVVYIGKVKYQTQLYSGEHDPLIEDQTWTAVQNILRANRPNIRHTNRRNVEGVLRGLVRCQVCNKAMFHTYSQKGSKLYRYYVCVNAQKKGYQTCPTRSLNAQMLEQQVIEQTQLSLKNLDLEQIDTTDRKYFKHLLEWDNDFGQSESLYGALHQFIERIEISSGAEQVHIRLNQKGKYLIKLSKEVTNEQVEANYQ